MKSALWVLCLVILVNTGCGYYSTKSRTAKDIKSVAVLFFENKTQEPNIEIFVTETVVRLLIEDNTLSVTNESNADAVLEGTLVGFINRPFSFNTDLNAEEYHVVVTLRATLFDRKINTPIWENKTIKGDGSYFAGSQEPGFTYEDALAESLKEITDRILNLTVQDW
jgi:hypothetical protein